MSEFEETSAKGSDDVGKLDEKKLKEYHYNTAWSMDTNIYKNDKQQYEFFKSNYSNNRDLNEHEREYLLKLVQSKFDKLNVQNRDTQERKERQCEDCKNLTRASQYCEFCIRNYLQRNFRKWTGNDKIDEAIQDAQKNVMGPDLVIEFIPFKRLKSLQKRSEGRFADIFDAVWIDGPFNKWNEKENILERIGNYNVILKRLKNSEQSASRWLNEILSHFKYDKIASNIVRCYGLTKEPNTGDFILVLNVMDFDLREFCKYLEETNLSISWKDRYQIIYKISACLHEIHQEGVIHKDLHPGNVLLRKNYEIRISDLGFCGPADKPSQHIYGSLPYIAPEVLCKKPYTTKADIYSLGVMMWMMSTGKFPFGDQDYDDFLANAIVCGLRPDINYGMPFEYEELMKQCWDAIPENRPDARTIYKKIYAMQKTLLDNEANDNTDSSIPSISSQNEFSKRKDLSITPQYLSSGPKNWLKDKFSSDPKNLTEDNRKKFSSGPKNWLKDKFSSDPKNLTEDNRKKFSSGPKNWVPNLYSSTNPSEAKNFAKGFEESGCLTTNEEFNKHLVEQDTIDMDFVKVDNIKSSNESSGTQDTDGFVVLRKESQPNVSNLQKINESFDNMKKFKRIVDISYLIFAKLHNETFSERYINKEIDKYIARNKETSSNIFTWLSNKKTDSKYICLLGRFYYGGIGTNEDKEMAYSLFSNASDMGNFIAKFYLGCCYYYGFGVQKDANKAFEWYSKAANEGNTNGQNVIGVFYEIGIGTTKNEMKAFEYYLKSSEGRNSWGQYNLGRCYKNGIGVIKNENKAFEWYFRSANSGNHSGQLNLGHCYRNGIGIAKDYSKAFKWYLKSAESNSPSGQVNVGFCYQNGIGVTEDEKKAFEWYLKSAEKGNYVAQRQLGLCYRNGIGTSQDQEKASEWSKKSESLRQEKAKKLENIESYHSGNSAIDKFIKESLFSWIPFSKLKKIRKLGKGGYADVYLGIWETDDETKPVALKLIRQSKDGPEELLGELEALDIVGSECPTFLRCYGISVDEDTNDFILVLQYAQRGSLCNNLHDIAQMEWKERLDLLSSIAFDLKLIHSQDIIHCDIHSNNILQDDLPNAYISDLGLAKSVNKSMSTKPDRIYGQLPYMAPEILRNKLFTKASDVYSFGMIMWEISSGEVVFSKSENDSGLAIEICHGLRPSIVKGTAKCYVDLLKKCWNADPEKRPTASKIYDTIMNWKNSAELCQEFLEADKTMPTKNCKQQNKNEIDDVSTNDNIEISAINAAKAMIESINSDVKHELSTDFNQNSFNIIPKEIDVRTPTKVAEAHDINYLLNEVEKAGESDVSIEYEVTKCKENQYAPNPAEIEKEWGSTVTIEKAGGSDMQMEYEETKCEENQYAPNPAEIEKAWGSTVTIEKAGKSTVPMEYKETKCKENQFVHPTDLIFKTLTSVAEASESFVPFAPLIEIFLKLGEDIVTLYQKAVHNKALCNYLTKRVNSAVAAINDLEIRKQDNQEFFKDAANLQLIKDFVRCMLDIRKFVADVSQLGSFGAFFNSNNIIQKYKDLSNRFDGYLNSLTFAMNRHAILYLQRIFGDTNDIKSQNGELKAQSDITIQHLESLSKDADEMKKKDLEMQYQINIIMTDLKEMKKFMHELSDSKEKNTLTKIKRIRDLNVSYQRNLRKGTEVSIEERSFLKLDDYEPKFDIPPRGKTIQCRWNNKFLLHYAFKEIPQITEDQKKDLSQQIAILKELKDSEHIIRFYGIATATDEAKNFLVTEWMENGNLRDYYKNHKLDWNKRFEFAIDICRGIAFLNAVEILHHDIRGANILINKDHKAKIANFGLSRRFGDITRNIQANLENVRYMAPEKLKHGDQKRYNVKCEIYSLGALLWEIAEEEIPYTRLGIDLQTIRDKVVKEKYREPFSSSVPKVWQDTAYAALNHNPVFRPTIAIIFSTLYEYHHKDEKRELLPIGDEFEDAFFLDDFDNSILSVDQAIEEHRKPDGNKQKAWESFKFHAELGDIMAKYWVGYYLYHSILPEHKENRQANLQHAAILFKETADHGKVEAQLRYGFCLWQGDGVPVNWDEAMRYLKLAADNGNPTAMYNVGSAYWIGKGVIKDQEEGSKYLKMAAKKDQYNAIAMCKKLGISY